MDESNYEVIYNRDLTKLIHTSCVCNSCDHMLTISVDATHFEHNGDQRSTDIDLSLMFKVHWSDYNHYDDNIFQRYWRRIKMAFKVLFGGHIEMEEEFLFRDATHARDVGNVILEAVDSCEKYIQDHPETKKYFS